ncbi:hypothetical protein RKD37_007313 [Streptomyces ambofaciens]
MPSWPWSVTTSSAARAAVGHLDVSVAQRPHHAGGVLEVADGHRLVVPLGEALVPVVAHEFGPFAVLVRLEGVRAGAHDAVAFAQGVRGVAAGVDDRHGGRGEDEREGGVGLVEVEDHLALARRLDPFETAEQAGRTAVDVDVLDPVDRVLDGPGVEPVAVGEGQSLTQFAAVHLVGAVGERALLGGVGLGRGGPARVTEERLVDVPEQLPGAVPGRGRIECAGGAGGPHDDRPLVLRTVGRQDAASGDQ